LTETAITVSGLRKSYGSNEAVRGIDFEVRSGEVFGFLGTNGAGKTTTIEILEGYRKRTGGEASVLGVDPGKPTRTWRERIGLVLQECELDPTLTVTETVTLFSDFFESPRPVDETVELVGLAEKRGARVGTLSGGQRRRVDVAVGIVGDPDLIFLDEPTTGFDPSARRDAWNMIEGLKELGKTIFLTTHYMDEAQHLADRVAILRAGKLVAQGRTEELGAGLGEATVVRFGLPAGVGPDELRSAVEGDIDVSGNQVTVRTQHPQKTLYKLTGWAERKGIELTGLEAERPSLEDIFLELTGDGAAAARTSTGPSPGGHGDV
jgi:ABC-2 type transport system ATP-binding protein